MIISKLKNISELLKALPRDDIFFVIGCGKCAKKLKIGGPVETEHMLSLLREEGFKTSGSCVISTACNINSWEKIKGENPTIEDATAFLILACGNGVSIIAMVSGKKAYPALDTTSIGGTCERYVLHEQCASCADCNIHFYHGICPTSQCPKGLQNGPCGGSVDGKCEISDKRRCAWEKIYEKAVNSGNLEVFTQLQPPKEHSRRIKLQTTAKLI
jgi:hypothetical protein